MMSTVDMIRQSYPELWSCYGQSMMDDMRRCMAMLVMREPARAPDPAVVQKMFESVVEQRTDELLMRAALTAGFTATCVLKDTYFGTIVFYHEPPLYERRNTCCVHLGVVHTGPQASDVWFCPRSQTFHAVTEHGEVSVPRDELHFVGDPLQFTLYAAERLMQKRPEVLAHPDENGYIN